MRLTIENKIKLEIFVALFQLLKNWSSQINMNFEKDKLYIQIMDKSHICLADIYINAKWFSEYKNDKNNKISVDSSHYATMMNYALKHDKLEIHFDDIDEPERLYITYLNDKENKSILETECP